ncbi:Uncharacterised protein [Mannheimia haemolytica]|uniref:Acyl-CoA dehydrogenase/oxidase N-terminal domain-containing protein n=1 Tax=Mannheimia haemolytica TaxID=75985 RepID=A0A378MWE4_MANHA|nr:Uncharacterised protein [Mannheimia haemolytica]
MSVLSSSFIQWLQQNAENLDQSNERADLLIPQIAALGLYKIGVPETLGGSGGTLVDAIKAVTELGNHSLAAAFVSWDIVPLSSILSPQKILFPAKAIWRIC